MRRIYIYVRVSDVKQLKEGDSLDAQEAACRRYAKSLEGEAEIVRVIREEGVSAYKTLSFFGRP